MLLFILYVVLGITGLMMLAEILKDFYYVFWTKPREDRWEWGHRPGESYQAFKARVLGYTPTLHQTDPPEDRTLPVSSLPTTVTHHWLR